jgi:hypothetical protein
MKNSDIPTYTVSYHVYENSEDEEGTLLHVECSGYFSPGKYYGPPENCYPDEEWFDIEAITIAKTGEKFTGILSEEDEKEIESLWWDEYKSGGDYEPDYEDDFPPNNWGMGPND